MIDMALITNHVGEPVGVRIYGTVYSPEEVVGWREEIERLHTALRAIDRHVVGGCETAFGDIEPCEECGDMRAIAASALRGTDAQP